MNGEDSAVDMLKLDEGTYIRNGGQVRPWNYFSQYIVAASTTPAVLFAQKKGDTLFTTLNTTNMLLPGQIPNSQRYDAYGVGIQYTKTATTAATAVTATMAAILAWLDTTAIEFNIADLSPRFQATLAMLMGNALGVVQQPAATQYDFSSASSVVSALFSFGVDEAGRPAKFTITANTAFNWTITPATAAAAAQVGDILKVWMYGRLWSRS